MKCPICRKGEDENHQFCVMEALRQNTEQLIAMTKAIDGIYNVVSNRIPQPDNTRGGRGGRY